MKSFHESNSQNAGKKRVPLDGSEALCKSSPFWILKRPADLASTVNEKMLTTMILR
jgi:hypothetical protein